MGLRGNKDANKNGNHKEPKKKALRIGIIQRGKLVEERWFRNAKAITVGAASNNTFHVEDADLPSRYPLFVATKEGIALQIPEGTRGKIVAEGRHLPLLKVESFGREVGRFTTREKRSSPSEQKTVYAVPMTEHMRGRLELGETTLLFQHATPPPAPETAPLPKLLAGSWHKGVDWAYASIIMLSFVAHSVGVYWLQQLGPLQNHAAGSFSNLRDRIQPELVVVPRPPKPRPSVAKDKSKEPKPAADKETRKDRRPRSRDARPKTTRATRAPKQTRVRNLGILKLLASKGGKSGSVNDLMSNDGTDAMFKTLRKLNGVSTAMEGRYRSRRRNQKLPKHLQLRQALIGGERGGKLLIGNKGPKRREGADITKVAKQFKMEIEKPGITGELKPGLVMKIIKRNFSSIKYCYERALKSNNTLKGKVTVEAMINQMGRARNLQVLSNTLGDKSVAACIKLRLRSLRFPRPKNGEVTIELPFVFTPNG